MKNGDHKTFFLRKKVWRNALFQYRPVGPRFCRGAMFKHGNMGQGIYADPARDFCGMYFGLATNDESVAGVDHSLGYLRAAAKALAGK